MSAKFTYVVKDAAGEYIAANGKRTPASNEAHEFTDRDEAHAACVRETDCFYARDNAPQSQPPAPVSPTFPLSTPQEITTAAEAFAAQLDHYDPFATQQRRAIMIALQSATAAQALRFAYALRRAVHPDGATRADVMLYNITRTIEGA